jgi:DNA-binding transcriptional regulator YhcF (GntR family)
MHARDREAEVPVIQLDATSPQPKYQQIIEQVKAYVAAGRLAPGASLPSVRQLASDLGINVNTVIAAYRVLDADGIVLLRHGSRAVIHPGLARRPEPGAGDVARLRLALERVRTEALLAGMSLGALRALALEIFTDATPQ